MTDKTKEAPARSALKLALEALECDPLDMALNPDGYMGFRKDQAITAIREALAEQPAIKQDLTPEQPAPVGEPRKPQQEPVAWMDRFGEVLPKEVVDKLPTDIPLYTSSSTLSLAQRPWVGLTDEEVKHEWVVWRASIPRYMGFAKGIEAKLKAKNSP